MPHYSHRRPLHDWLEAGVTLELHDGRPHGWDPPTQRLGCTDCGEYQRIPIGGIDMVHAQMRMYRGGWRRDPRSGRDYCPTHAARSLTRRG